MHIDMNSYFASVEQQANPFLREKPIGVTGKSQKRSVIAAASIEAKRLGVKTGMSTWEAKRVCPTLLFIAGDPEKYSEITHRFNRLFLEITDRVEPFSVDESFLDVTDAAKDYFGAVCISQYLRTRLRETCGEQITASIGIGPNRLIAKLSSECIKPNGLTVTQPDRVLELLDRVKLEDVCGIGPRIAEHLDALGIHTFKQLREYPLEQLVVEFHSFGLWLHAAAHGQDTAAIKAGPMISHNQDPKSLGHSYTLPKDATNPTLVRRYVLALCDRVAWRLRRDAFLAYGIHASVRFGDFTSWGAHKVVREPVSDGRMLMQIAWQMMKHHLEHPKGVRLVGISATHLAKGTQPLQLFHKERKQQELTTALDRLSYRYGPTVWTRACLIPIKLHARSSGFHFDHEI